MTGLVLPCHGIVTFCHDFACNNRGRTIVSARLDLKFAASVICTSVRDISLREFGKAPRHFRTKEF
jgi:hypothetical protein